MNRARKLPSTLCLILVGGAVHAQSPMDEDGIFTNSPGPASIHAGLTGVAPATNGLSGVGAAVQWSGLGAMSLVGSSDWGSGGLRGSIAVRRQLLTRAQAPVEASAWVRLRSEGLEHSGPGFELKLGVGREVGAVNVAINAALGKALVGRQDLDFELAASFTKSVSDSLRVGFEGRVRGELIDELKTSDDVGRPVGFAGGPAVVFRSAPVSIHVLAGWSIPRGTDRPGALVLGAAAVDF
jgi:hypothetical protein